MKVLILGDGLLGSEIQKQTGWDIISRKKDGIDFNNPDSYVDYIFDFIDDKHYGRLGVAPKYTHVVNCIASTDTYSNNPEDHIKVNYHSLGRLVKMCNIYGVKLVHISTEYVYAGNTTPPSEEDIPLPVPTWYGCSKLLGDFYVQNNSNNFLLCRLLHKDKNLEYEKVWKAQTSGDTVDKIAAIVVKLIENNARGTFNVGTGDKYLKDFIKASEEVDPPKITPSDTRMDLTKLNSFLECI